ncbi:MAG: autotransporter outer membrane beta-barrel domain-containing protein [Hyphomonadaceae bacterium]|jgi:hypothetical protein|nr:autotransporter outer membrane beta-barrel domain-containing protein [Hyphomonadaceae bacterium]
MAFVLACVMAGPQVATGQSGRDASGTSSALPGINLLGLVTTNPASINLGSNGLSATLPGLNAAGVVTTSPAAISLSSSGLGVAVSGVNVAGGLIKITPTSVSLSDKGLGVTLSGVNVAGLVATTPTSVNLGGGGSMVVLPNITVGGQSLWTLPTKDVINSVSPMTQVFAGMGSAEAFAPVEQLLNGLAFGNDAPSGCANASTIGPLPATETWTWNASTVGRTDRDGYRVDRSDGTSCGTTLPFQTVERAQLPGGLWDASSAFGFKKGTLHLGFSGGATESDTQVKANAALRDAGIVQAGTNRLRSWSFGGFSLLTKENWYAGSALGGAWGRAESQNFVLGSDSDYNTSTVVAAGFIGTIMPLTEAMRFDLRGTLSYQRTVGEAHVDSLGLVYGDHIIEAADAMLSGRLFGVFQNDAMTIRPFIQAGLKHRLSYSNQLEIDGIAFTLQEADTSIFSAVGIDFEIDKSLQLSVGVRHDRSPDSESLTGRFGFLLRFN